MSAESAGLRAARAGILVHGDGSVLEDAAVAWRGEEIVAVGPWRALRRALGDAPCDGGRDAVIVPGLVNAHQHGHGLTSLAGGVADQPLEGWLAEGLGIPVPSDRAGILVAAARLIRSGVTSAVHLHACRRPVDPERMLRRLDAYRESGLNVGFASGFKSRHRFALVEDDAFLRGLDASLRAELLARCGEPPSLDYLAASDWEAAIAGMVRSTGSDDRVRLLVGPAGPEWSTPEDLAFMARVASELGLPVQVHVAESRIQARHAELLPAGEAGLGALDRAGLLGPRTSLVHAVQLAPADLDLVAQRGAMLVTCPGSNMRLGHGIAPIRAARDRGIAVALGSDSVGFGDRDDLWSEARLLLGLHGGALPGTAALDVPFAWTALTANGARAAGMPRAGRLEPGARADLVLLDGASLVAPAGEWLGDPAATVLGRARPEDVRLVVASGRELLRDGRILSFDEKAVEEEAAEATRAHRDAASSDLARRLAMAVDAAHRARGLVS